jgi:hypothetical protein
LEGFEMAKPCDECKRILIPRFNKAVAASIAAAILSYAVYEENGHCPYLADHYHTPRDVIMPPEFSFTFTVAASSGEYWEHDAIIGRFNDPEVEGNTVHLFEWK